MKTPTLETDRLILREIYPNDTQAIFNGWMNDENVSRYMWWKAKYSLQGTTQGNGLTGGVPPVRFSM